jgi:Tetratricopeptide repeat
MARFLSIVLYPGSMKFALIYFIALSACLPLAMKGQDQPQDQPTCSSYAQCNDLGTAAFQHGRLDEAIRLFEEQAVLAEIADIKLQTSSQGASRRQPYKLPLTAYNNLALAYFNKHDYFRARAWALVALRRDKNNQAAQFNLRKIQQALDRWQWPQTTAGEYIQYAGRATWQSMIVKSLSPDSIDFCFSGLWWGLGEAPSGIGDVRAVVSVHNGVAEYSTREFSENECRISIHFYADRLEVTQTGDGFDCGFGHNVTANGPFQRISSSAECPPDQR